ncbi:MAG TPA: ParA family protein [Thermoanaerobaculia bacterium]|nr:ParA family protein [Thermoanaerobaculia bacterium]
MICAVVSKKGGVGKTTTAVTLAAALAEAGRRVLLVDLDSQASASLSVGVGRERLAPSVADVLLWGTPAREAIRASGVPRLDLLTASADLASADLELGSFRQRESRLAAALEHAAADYDQVILDCPPGLPLLAVNALVAADVFVVPVPPQFLALAGAETLLAAAERLRANYNPKLSLAGLLLTMVDYRTAETRRNVQRIRERYGDAVFAVEVRINTRLAEAPGAAQTILQYDSKASGAQAYRLVAEEYLLRAERLTREPVGPIRS